jgi:DNA repair protein RadD
MIELRDYQKKAVDSAINYIKSNDRAPAIIVAPTGAGKSWEIAGIAKEYPDPILILQPSVELLKQNFEKFTLMGGDASIFSAGAKEKVISHVTYATIGSVKSKVSELIEAGVKLVIIDECHHGISPEAGSVFSKFIKALNPTKVIGLTATPFRLKSTIEGSKLSMLNRIRPGFFKRFIHVTQIKEMIDRGYWCPSIEELWTMDEGTLRLNTNGTEFTEDSIRMAIEANGINNKIYLRVKELLSQGSRKSILVFADSVSSCEKFKAWIPGSEFLSSDTKDSDRNRIVSDFKEGKIRVLFNYGILSTGFDFPGLDCIVMGRPTNSLSAFYQIYGRGVRTMKGKENFLFVDYCNNFTRLAHPRDITIENFEDYGWGVFANDRLVTGIPLDGPVVTKSDLLNKSKSKGSVKSNLVFPFGKNKNKKVIDVYKKDPSYIHWLLKQDWLDAKFKASIEALVKELTIGSTVLKPVKVGFGA